MRAQRGATPEQFDALIASAVDARQHIQPTIVPVFGRKDDKVDLRGTGVLLRAGSTHLLMSAAHVFDSTGDAPIVPLNGELRFPLRGPIAKTIAPEEGRYHDPFDFGAVQLEPDEIAGLSRYRFASDGDLFHQTSRAIGIVGYAIGGYPATTVRRDWHDDSIEGQVRFALGPEVKPADYARCKVASRSHLIVHQDKIVQGPRGVGHPFKLPGLSGAGAWRIVASVGNPVPARPYLVGLFIERSPLFGQALVCVRTGVLMCALAMVFEEVYRGLPKALVNNTEEMLGPLPKLEVLI